MPNTENLGPEYRHDQKRRFVWSRRDSSPWTLALIVIATLLVASSVIVATFLLKSHPGTVDANSGVETQRSP